MLRLSGALRRRVQRLVHPAGAQVRLQPPLGAYGEAGTAGAAWAIASAGGNVLLTGPAGTGKLTALRDIAGRLEAAGKRVALTAVSSAGTTAVGGVHLLAFLGLRPSVPAPEPVQAAESILRHVRLARGNGMAETVATVDVLLVMGLEGLSIEVLQALDMGAREARECPDKPFGGLQIVAAANFWRQPGVHPTSPLHGYIHQHPLWRVAFPQGHELVTHTFWRHRAAAKTEEEAALLSQMTLKALFGHFTPDDADALEALTPPPTAVQIGATAEGLVGRDAIRSRMDRPGDSPDSGSADVAPPVDVAASVLDHLVACSRWAPKFPLQQRGWDTIRHWSLLRSTSTGFFFSNLLPWLSGAVPLGFVDRLDLRSGDHCVTTHPLDLPPWGPAGDAKGAGAPAVLPAGTPCIVESAQPHFIAVRVANSAVPRLCDGVTPPPGTRYLVRRARVTTQVDGIPGVWCAMSQFPLAPADVISSQVLLAENYIPRRLFVDARLLTNTNDLGNILAHVGAAEDLRFRPGSVARFLSRPGMVHEATRVYYQSLLAPPALAAIGAPELELCRNCKVHVPRGEFDRHWRDCLATVRWCADCGKTVPVAKWEAHSEKHAVVMCIDCGKAVHWRDWERHRLDCEWMLAEMSAVNPMIPTATRDARLTSSVDDRDLNTVKRLNKGSLPRGPSAANPGPPKSRSWALPGS